MKTFVNSATSLVLSGFFLGTFKFFGVESMIVRASSNDGDAAAAPQRALLESESLVQCDFYPEIVVVQDISDSYGQPLKNLAALMPSFFNYLQDRFDNKVKVSFVSFVDKSVNAWNDDTYEYRPNYGYEDDFCAHVELPLTAVDEAGTVDNALGIYNGLVAGGGLGWIEGAADALYRTVVSDSVGWSAESVDALGNKIVRIVVVATDAMSHLPNEFPDFPLLRNDLVDRPEAVAKDINAECGILDSPTADDMRKALTQRGVIPVFLAARPTFFTQDGTEYTWLDIENFSNKMDRPEFNRVDTGLVNYYSWYLSEYLGVDGVVQYMDRDSAEFVSVFDAAIKDVTSYYCNGPDVTDTTTTTTTATTTTTTTTASTMTTTTTDDNNPIGPVVPDDDLDTTTTTTTTTVAPDGDTTTTTAAAGPGVVDTTTVGPDGTTTTDESSSSFPAGVVVGAAGGGAAALAAAGLLGAKRMGVLFNNSSTPDVQVGEDVENVEIPADREQFEAVTGELFA